MYTACRPPVTVHGTLYTVHSSFTRPSWSRAQSLVTAPTMRCLALLLAVAAATAVKTTTNDYLQPYKFVKPLKDLEDLYKKADTEAEAGEEDAVAELSVEEAEEAEAAPDKLQSRSGEAHPVAAAPLMSDELSPPAPKSESLPVAAALTARKRQRSSASSRHQFRDRMSNHKIEDEEEEEEIEVGEAEDEADVSKDMDEDMQDLLQEAAAKAAAVQVEAAAEDSCKDQLKATSSQTTSSLAQGSEISAV